MQDWDIKTIVVGYDGSAGARAAARLAAALAKQNKARVVVVTSFHWTFSLDAMGEQVKQVADEAQACADSLVTELREQGVEAVSEVQEGDAGRLLIQVAETQGADLLVVGRRGHGVAASLLLGSTSEYVVRRATVPVLVAH